MDFSDFFGVLLAVDREALDVVELADVWDMGVVEIQPLKVVEAGEGGKYVPSRAWELLSDSIFKLLDLLVVAKLMPSCCVPLFD